MKYKLIGITGYAGSGKDTIAGFLDGYKRLAFADSLKYICMGLFGLKYEEVFGELKDTVLDRKPFKKDMTPRKILQYFGTEIVRNQFGNLIEKPENYWINLIEKIITDNPETSYVVTDVRFNNEVEFIKNLGGTIVEVKRPGIEPCNKHPSESGVKGVDIVIDNDGTLEDLKSKVNGIFNE